MWKDHRAALAGNFFAILVVGCWHHAAHAKEPVYNQQYDKCLERSNGITFAMIECMTAEIAIWDRVLNANYKTLMASLSADQKKALTAAQLVWIKFRDANCAFVSDPAGGTSARMKGNDCYLRMTAERAMELRDFQPPK